MTRRGGEPGGRKTAARHRARASLAAALWLGATLSAAPVSAAPPDARAVAQKVYQEGAAHYKAGHMLEALAAFKASYDMVPSPNSHLMIARTLRDRGDLVDAFLEYQKLVPEAEAAAAHEPKYGKTVDTARGEKEKVRARIAFVKVHVKSPPDDLRITMGSRAIGRSDWEAPVPALAGMLTLRAETRNAPVQEREITTTAGSDVEVTFDFTPAPKEPPRLVEVPVLPPKPGPSSELPSDIPRQPLPPPRVVDRTLPTVFLGVGAAGLATFVVFGALNESTFHDLETACPGNRCSSDTSDKINKGRTEQTIANVGLGVAVVAGSVAGILFATAADREHRLNSAALNRPRVTSVGLGPDGLAVQGAF